MSGYANTDASGVKRLTRDRQPGLLQLALHVEQTGNGTLRASIMPASHVHGYVRHNDDIGALCYVVVIIFLYACSILMMIASYIRKNKEDRRLKRYLKEMAFVRKRELRMSVMSAATKARQHADDIARRRSGEDAPETASADDGSTSSFLHAPPCVAPAERRGALCRTVRQSSVSFDDQQNQLTLLPRAQLPVESGPCCDNAASPTGVVADGVGIDASEVDEQRPLVNAEELSLVDTTNCLLRVPSDDAYNAQVSADACLHDALVITAEET